MEVENSERNSSFLNKAFVKSFLAGIVIGFVSLLWMLIRNMFGLNQINRSMDWSLFAINCVLPLLLVYFAGKVVTSALGRYGFEGWKREYMTFSQLFSAILGLFVAIVVFLILSMVWAIVAIPGV